MGDLSDHYLLQDWPQISAAFQLNISVEQVSPLGNGLINDTYFLTDTERFVLQRINHQVFSSPLKVQENFDRASKLLAVDTYPYETLSAKLTHSGDSLCQTNGRYWRVMPFINGARSFDYYVSDKLAFSGAEMLGRFHTTLKNVSCTEFHETIPNFHNLTTRLTELKKSIDSDRLQKVKRCRKELSIVESFAHLAKWQTQCIEYGIFNRRITHNDPKMSNLLFCDTFFDAKAIIDWDTIMPGYWQFDYADMIRSFVPRTPDENDTQTQSKAAFLCKERFQVVTSGYMSIARDHMTKLELQSCFDWIQLTFFMLGVRYLTDFINGDTYFKTAYDEQNLHRCQKQFSLLQQFAADGDYFKSLIKG